MTTKDAKFVQLEPEVYTPEELVQFFAACTPFQFLVFKTYLMSGLRKQERENLEWTDINFAGGIIKVCPKPGWLPKTWEEREIEVADGRWTVAISFVCAEMRAIPSLPMFACSLFIASATLWT